MIQIIFEYPNKIPEKQLHEKKRIHGVCYRKTRFSDVVPPDSRQLQQGEAGETGMGDQFFNRFLWQF